MATQSNENVDAKGSPAGIKALLSGPDMISTFEIKFSPFWNSTASALSIPWDSYWRYRANSPSVESWDFTICSIVALTPDVAPNIFWSNNWSI